ncbi:MAG TPA: DciA family protein [Patescibacteria group bacterium]|nr:DciA family protein [Patescibacteria group bacterium]
MFEPLKDLLPKTALKNKFANQTRAYQILEYSHTVIETVCGRLVSENVKPVSLREDAITFACMGAVFAQEITLRRNEILQKINEKYRHGGKKDIVKKIRFLF